jgi:ABC-type multidrug transport system fused ATPase/permease subunit
MKQLATDKMVAADEELKIETESLAKLLLPITDPKK